jgi:hypothetical protein
MPIRSRPFDIREFLERLDTPGYYRQLLLSHVNQGIELHFIEATNVLAVVHSLYQHHFGDVRRYPEYVAMINDCQR